MTKRRINLAIRHTGLTVEGNQWDGVHYFLDEEGYQVGETLYICYLNQCSLPAWVAYAESALEQGRV